jgi:SPP1 family predicted phage head-tail adaptor
MSIAAGRLRHWVTLERFTFVQDSAGDPIQDPVSGELRKEWTEVAQLWAAIEPSSAREFIASQVGQSEVTGKIIIRYRPDVLATDRIVHNGRAYQLFGVLGDLFSGMEYLTLPCGTGLNTGE